MKRSANKFINRAIGILLLMTLILAACGKTETIDGKWVLVKQTFPDGEVCEGDSLMASESYEIEGDKGVFTSVSDILNGKPVTFDVMVNEIGKNKYEFKITDSLVLSTGSIDGKRLVFTYDDGSKFFLRRKNNRELSFN